MRIAVIGAGGIGGFLAAALAQGGVPVVVVARGAHLDAIRRDGIVLDRSDFGPFSARVDAGADLREFGEVDVILATFKAHQYEELIPQLAPAVRRGAHLVTLQNGVPFWFRRTPPLRTVDPCGRIGELFPDTRTIGGVVHVSGHVNAPGHLEQSGGTRYVLGALDPANRGVLEELVAAMRRARLEPDVRSDIRHDTWSKLVNNASYNPASAKLGLSIHQLIEQPAPRALVAELMRETIAVGRRLGVSAEDGVEARMAASLAKADVRTSMLQDIDAHRPLELDPIVGAVVELGEDLGVPVPQLRAIYDELRERTAAFS